MPLAADGSKAGEAKSWKMNLNLLLLQLLVKQNKASKHPM
jgi:hypothetical protein